MATINNVNHFSYSLAKDIYRKGIDYALAVKLGVVEKKFGKAVDIGQLVHNYILGGDQDFVIQKYTNFRTKEAREWRDSQTLPIISEEDFAQICKIAERVKSHPLASKLLLSDGVEHEVKLSERIANKEWIGYADALGYDDADNVKYGVDLKTTAQFDDFKWTSSRNDYDMQAAVYSLIAKIESGEFYWVVAETVPPYRVGVAVASQEFLDNGYQKLERVVGEIKKFDAREGKDDLSKLNFNMNTSIDNLLVLGDWSN